MATHSSVLPGESQGRGSLVGCRLWGRTESGTTEVTAAVTATWKSKKRDLTGGPVAKAPHSPCSAPGFNPWLGN